MNLLILVGLLFHFATTDWPCSARYLFINKCNKYILVETCICRSLSLRKCTGKVPRTTWKTRPPAKTWLMTPTNQNEDWFRKNQSRWLGQTPKSINSNCMFGITSLNPVQVETNNIYFHINTWFCMKTWIIKVNLNMY